MRPHPLHALEAAVGDLRRWRRHWRHKRDLAGQDAIHDRLVEAAPAAADDPVLVFSATWRSGSTLVQRILMSDPDLLVWGEPWNRTDVVPRLRESLGPVDERWPGIGAVVDDASLTEGPALSERWVANLFPTERDVVESHRALFRRLLAEPAFERGYRRWGAKWVRLDAADARYLRLLFPEASMIFVHRDPVDAWASYQSKGLVSYRRFPDDPVFLARRFARLWSERVSTFVSAAGALGVHVIAYEDLAERPATAIAAIGRSTGTRLDPEVASRRIGAAAPRPLHDSEVRTLRRHTRRARSMVGRP